ncbi:MAG: hypothetical protein ACTSVY_10730 [Candidatus Helarchaeota archaeon]
MPRGIELDDSVIFDKLWEEKREKEKKSKNIVQLWVNMFQWPIPVNGIAIDDLTGDGYLEIAGVSDDHFLKIFNHEGKELWKKDLFDAVIFTKIGKLSSKENNDVLVGGADKKLHVFDKNGNEIWHKDSKKWWYNAKIIDINNDGFNEVIAGSRDRYLYCLTGKTGLEIWKHGFDAYIKHLDAIDNIIAAASDDGTLNVFNNKGNVIFSDELDERIMYCKMLKNNNKIYLSVASAEGEFKVYDLDNNKILLEKELDEKLTSFLFTDKLKGILSIIYGDENADLCIMNMEGKKLWEISTVEENYCIEVGDILSNNEMDIIIGGKDSMLRIINGNNGTVRSYFTLDNHVTNILLADINKDGKSEIITAGRDRTVRVFQEQI